MDKGKHLVGKRKKKQPSCPNPLFLHWLTEIRDEAAGRGLKTQYVYAKAIRSLSKYPLPLPSGKACKILENFGDKICKMLDDKLVQHIAEYGSAEILPEEVAAKLCASPKRPQKGKTGVNHPGHNHNRNGGTCISDGSGSESEHVYAPPPKQRRTSGGGSREYLPQPGSGPYALLLTLLDNHQSTGGKGVMSKKDLMREAQPLADKSFTIPDPGSRYTAWSSMGTLIKKGLVIKESSPAKYRLTQAGVDLGERLRDDSVPSSCGQADNLGFVIGAGPRPRETDDLVMPSVFTSTPLIPDAISTTVFRSDREPVKSCTSLLQTIDSDSGDDVEDLPSLGMRLSRLKKQTSNQAVHVEISPSSTWSDPAQSQGGGENTVTSLKFSYISEEGNCVESKDKAAVSIDDDLGGLGFLVRCPYGDLLMSEKLYKLDNSRPMRQGERYAYLADRDAPETAPQAIAVPVSKPEKISKKQIPSKGPSEPGKAIKSATTFSSSTSSVSAKDCSGQNAAVRHMTLTQKDVPGPSCKPGRELFRVSSQSSSSEFSQGSTTSASTASSDLPEPGFSLQPRTFEVVLCVDKREHYGGAKSSKQMLMPELQKHKTNFELRNLQVGDFAWIARSKVAPNPEEELVLDYIVERKRMDDLASSIPDGRFREQKIHPVQQMETTQQQPELTGNTKHLPGTDVNTKQMETTKQHLHAIDVNTKQMENTKQQLCVIDVNTKQMETEGEMENFQLQKHSGGGYVAEAAKTHVAVGSVSQGSGDGLDMHSEDSDGDLFTEPGLVGRSNLPSPAGLHLKCEKPTEITHASSKYLGCVVPASGLEALAGQESRARQRSSKNNCHKLKQTKLQLVKSTTSGDVGNQSITKWNITHQASRAPGIRTKDDQPNYRKLKCSSSVSSDGWKDDSKQIIDRNIRRKSEEKTDHQLKHSTGKITTPKHDYTNSENLDPENKKSSSCLMWTRQAHESVMDSLSAETVSLQKIPVSTNDSPDLTGHQIICVTRSPLKVVTLNANVCEEKVCEPHIDCVQQLLQNCDINDGALQNSCLVTTQEQQNTASASQTTDQNTDTSTNSSTKDKTKAVKYKSRNLCQLWGQPASMSDTGTKCGCGRHDDRSSHDPGCWVGRPELIINPVREPLAPGHYVEIYFDLEATGRGVNSHITQFAAVTPQTTFNRYVTPKVRISQEASKVTGITYFRGKMKHHKRRVYPIPMKQCLQEFIRFVGKQQVLLVGHNINMYDARVLFNAALGCGMAEQLAGSICGFLDTPTLFRAEYGDVVRNFSQEALVRHFLGQSYEAHDARADATVLKQLVKHCNFSPRTKLKHTFSVLYIQHSMWYEEEKKENLKSLVQLIEAQVLSESMAAKVAGSGLCYTHLAKAFLAGGKPAIYNLMTRSAWDTKPSVTKSRKVIDRLAEYLESS